MKNRKMKADSVDQLFEIVKAVQMGQDPEEMLRKKQAESAPLADSPKSNPELNDRPENFGDMEELTAEKPRRKSVLPKKNSGSGVELPGETDADDFIPEKTARENIVQEEPVLDEDDGWDDDDAFLEILNDDSDSRLDVGSVVDKICGGLVMLSGIFASSKKDRSNESGKRKDSARKGKNRPEMHPGIDAKKWEESLKDAVEKRNTTEWNKEEPVRVEQDKKEQDKKERDKEEPDKKEPDREVQTEEEAQEKSEDEKTIDRILEIPNAAGAEENEQSASELEEVTELPDEGIDLEEDAIRAKSDREQEASIRRKISGRLKKEQEPIPDQLKEKPRRDGLREAEEEKQKLKLSDIPGMIGNFFRNLADGLREKGIHRRELMMLTAGLVPAIAVILMLSNFIKNSMEDKRKSEYVTADSGLNITVEKEPQQWCQSYPVSLKVRVKGSIAPKVTIDGAYYEPGEDGMITIRAGDYLLQASVESEDGILNAQIEIPKLDAQAPVVSAARENNMITLTAADGRSGISKIWYAAVRESDYIKIPYYTEYTEPFLYEAGTLYYFFAEDLAGNKSMPVVTTMEEAREIAPAVDELCLFPGETAYLHVDGNPSGSLLNNLSFESMNPSVVTVDQAGHVTALAEGTTAVKIKADGLLEVLCTVEVSRSRSITISAIGDCTLGSDASFNTNTNFQAFETVNGPSYFFRNVSDILANDDVTFANLEGVFTDLNTRENKQYAFKGDPDYTQILLDGSVEVVTLANNHSSDYGEQSQKDTKQYLSSAGIDYCIGDTIAMQEIKGVKTAFIGIYVLYDGMAREEQVRATIAEARAQGAQLVVVGFHWGSEKATQPDQTQTSLAYIAIDAGADLVVGHHPHVLQGIEKYNGKYIVYSLGNFCFGGNTNPSDKDTIIFRQTFTIMDGAVQEDDQIEIVPCSISASSGYNDYQPTPVSGAEADRIMERLNEYSEPFGQSFTASDGLYGAE